MIKRYIEVQQVGGAWTPTQMKDLRVGDRIRMWERESKDGCYLGCFRVDGVPTQGTDGIWRVVAAEET